MKMSEEERAGEAFHSALNVYWMEMTQVGSFELAWAEASEKISKTFHNYFVVLLLMAGYPRRQPRGSSWRKGCNGVHRRLGLETFWVFLTSCTGVAHVSYIFSFSSSWQGKWHVWLSEVNLTQVEAVPLLLPIAYPFAVGFGKSWSGFVFIHCHSEFNVSGLLCWIHWGPL